MTGSVFETYLDRETDLLALAMSYEAALAGGLRLIPTSVNRRYVTVLCTRCGSELLVPSKPWCAGLAARRVIEFARRHDDL